MSRIVFLQAVKQVPTWRNEWPAAELRRRGHEVVHLGFQGDLEGEILPTDTVILHVTAELWSPGEGIYPAPIAAELRASCRRLVVQFDDDWTAIRDIQPWTNEAAAFVGEIIECCRLASFVIAATPTLADVYGKWARTVVVRNYPPRWVLELPTGPKTERLGWMGRLGVHTADLELLKPFAHELPPMLLVGTGQEGVELLRSWGARDVEATEPTDEIHRLYRDMSRCAVAIIPLCDTAFNRGKSWNKPLEFACQGVPSICSPHSEYAELTLDLFPHVVETDRLAATARYVSEWSRPSAPRPAVLTAGLVMEDRGGAEWERALDIA